MLPHRKWVAVVQDGKELAKGKLKITDDVVDMCDFRTVAMADDIFHEVLRLHGATLQICVKADNVSHVLELGEPVSKLEAFGNHVTEPIEIILQSVKGECFKIFCTLMLWSFSSHLCSALECLVLAVVLMGSVSKHCPFRPCLQPTMDTPKPGAQDYVCAVEK